MFSKWYAIKGITSEMYNEWKDNMRQDILAFEDGKGVVHIHIKLTLIEALWMRHLIYRNNKRQDRYVLALVTV